MEVINPIGWLHRSRSARFSRLNNHRYREDFEHIITIVATLYPIEDGDRELKRWLRETEYDLGLRKRLRSYTQRGSIAPGPCVRHLDRRGVYIIDNQRYCRSCATCIRRHQKEQYHAT